MDLSDFKLNDRQVKALESDPEVLDAVQKWTDETFVSEVRRRAPKETGEGAESIASEPDPDQPGFRVSWGKDQFYMAFHELGTVHQPARPFLRPTADKYRR